MELSDASQRCPFTIRLADLPIGVDSHYDFTRTLCRDYLTDDAPVFTVQATQEDVAVECREPGIAPDYAESLCLYRAMAEKLPHYDRMVFHGAAIAYEGRAYLFTAPSGTGKTTHITLWRRYIGEQVQIINGDKPILRRSGDGFIVYGTPYAGKEGWQRNVSAPLAAICLLHQGTGNTIVRKDRGMFLPLFKQTYRPREREAMIKTTELVKALCAVPCYELTCDMSREAVMASFAAMTGRKEG